MPRRSFCPVNLTIQYIHTCPSFTPVNLTNTIHWYITSFTSVKLTGKYIHRFTLVNLIIELVHTHHLPPVNTWIHSYIYTITPVILIIRYSYIIYPDQPHHTIHSYKRTTGDLSRYRLFIPFTSVYLTPSHIITHICYSTGWRRLSSIPRSPVSSDCGASVFRVGARRRLGAPNRRAEWGAKVGANGTARLGSAAVCAPVVRRSIQLSSC